MTPPKIGDLSKAFHVGYRVTVHGKFFPYNGHDAEGNEVAIHAQIDHGARAIFCSQEWYDALPKVPA